MAVNRHITASAHQSGNFTAGKLPTITPIIYEEGCQAGNVNGWKVNTRDRSRCRCIVPLRALKVIEGMQLKETLEEVFLVKKTEIQEWRENVYDGVTITCRQRKGTSRKSHVVFVDTRLVSEVLSWQLKKLR